MLSDMSILVTTFGTFYEDDSRFLFKDYLYIFFDVWIVAQLKERLTWTRVQGDRYTDPPAYNLHVLGTEGAGHPEAGLPLHYHWAQRRAVRLRFLAVLGMVISERLFNIVRHFVNNRKWRAHLESVVTGFLQHESMNIKRS
jgi:hypothetical protein